MNTTSALPVRTISSIMIGAANAVWMLSLGPDKSRKKTDEDRWTLPLRRDHLRGGGRSQRAHHLPLHRLPDTHRLSVSREHPRSGRAFRAPHGHAKELCEDGRKREQTPPRLLRQLRHAHLCLRSRQSAELCLARRYDHAACGLYTAAARLAAFCPALGGRARRRTGRREGLDKLSRNAYAAVASPDAALPPTRYIGGSPWHQL